MSDESPAPRQFVLPDNLISFVDLSRVRRELAALDDSFYQAGLRKAGQPTQLSRSSRTLEDLASANQVSLLDAAHRAQLIATLDAFDKQAQQIHMSFAAEPSAKFVSHIIVWLRQNIHSLILLEIGLQPSLAAGCMVRTNNKMIDMSLRHRFFENRHLLDQKIRETYTP